MLGIFQGDAPGISLSVTATASAEVALPTKEVIDSIATGDVQIRIVNEGPNIAFVHVGKTGVVATVPATGAGTKTCMAVLAGSDVVFTLPPGASIHGAAFISAICRASGTAVLSIYIGRGV